MTLRSVIGDLRRGFRVLLPDPVQTVYGDFTPLPAPGRRRDMRMISSTMVPGALETMNGSSWILTAKLSPHLSCPSTVPFRVQARQDQE
jgi:hypothetical protein